MNPFDRPEVIEKTGDIERVSDEIEALQEQLAGLVVRRENLVIEAWGMVGSEATHGKMAAVFRGRKGLGQSNIRRIVERGPRDC